MFRKFKKKIRKRFIKVLAKFFKLCFSIKKDIYWQELSNSKIREGNPIISTSVLCVGNGKVKFGKGTQLGWFPSPCYFDSSSFIGAFGDSSYVEIGDNTVINNHFTISAEFSKIKIGKNCLIGVNFYCLNSDGHGLKVEDRRNPEKISSQDIEKGDDVFIGSNVTILKGVKIGNGAIIGANSVVTKNVPDYCIFAGNPARFIKKLDEK